MDRTQFKNWLNRVDDICYRKYGMSIHDLPDMDFASSFEDGESPESFIENEIPDLDALRDLIMS